MERELERKMKQALVAIVLCGTVVVIGFGMLGPSPSDDPTLFAATTALQH